MTVKIHNKIYKTVAERVAEFHADHKNGSIRTELMDNSNGTIMIKAVILPDSDKPERYFTGYASEKVGATMINKTSALENAETSAVGRALAFAGYIGTEIASANEVEQAIKGQNEVKPASKVAKPPKDAETAPEMANMELPEGFEIDPDGFITVEQALEAKAGDMLNIQAPVFRVYQKPVGEQGSIKTNYLVGEGQIKMYIGVWGSPELEQGIMGYFIGVKVEEYNGKIYYNADQARA